MTPKQNDRSEETFIRFSQDKRDWKVEIMWEIWHGGNHFPTGEHSFLCAFHNQGIEMTFMFLVTFHDDILVYVCLQFWWWQWFFKFHILVVHCDSKGVTERKLGAHTNVRIYISSGSCHKNKTAVLVFLYLHGSVQGHLWGCDALNVAAAKHCGTAFSTFLCLRSLRK